RVGMETLRQNGAQHNKRRYAGHQHANRSRGISVREKELRIALVCFGGVSLAVYMHGITKEILKLARASSAVHGIIDRARRRAAHFSDVRDKNDPEHDTEAVYFDLLRDIGRAVELRIIVDIIAGASAGGINAAMLARALSRDLPMGRLRDLWLEKADVTEMIAAQSRARGWSKWFLRPLFLAAGLARLQNIRDPEGRRKLSPLMRSRWVKRAVGGAKGGGADVRGPPRHGRAARPARDPAAERPRARPVRPRDGFLRLPAAHAAARPAGGARTRAPAHAALPFSPSWRRRRQRFRARGRAGARLRRAPDLVPPPRVSAGAPPADR